MRRTRIVTHGCPARLPTGWRPRFTAPRVTFPRVFDSLRQAIRVASSHGRYSLLVSTRPSPPSRPVRPWAIAPTRALTRDTIAFACLQCAEDCAPRNLKIGPSTSSMIIDVMMTTCHIFRMPPGRVPLYSASPQQTAGVGRAR
jgi:hypothetical protein